jgi:hypothetical protein
MACIATLLVVMNITTVAAARALAAPARQPGADRSHPQFAFQISPPPATRGQMPNYLPEIPWRDRVVDTPRSMRTQQARPPQTTRHAKGITKRTVQRSHCCSRFAGRRVSCANGMVRSTVHSTLGCSARLHRRVHRHGTIPIRPSIEHRAYSWPYRLRTSRQWSPTRWLLAARVAPQRSRLLQVMPPDRSQNFAAARRQAASSFRSSAPAPVADAARNTIAAMDLVIAWSLPVCPIAARPRLKARRGRGEDALESIEMSVMTPGHRTTSSRTIPMAERRTHPFGSTAKNKICSARRHGGNSTARA